MSNFFQKKRVRLLFASLLLLSILLLAMRQKVACFLHPKRCALQGRGLYSEQHCLPLGKNVARDFGTAIADAVDRVMPSVVVIRSRGVGYQLYQDFFGHPQYRVRKEISGQGSGVIIDERGYVLTSRHVLLNSREVEVVLNDETVLPAQVVGEDRSTDLAVLKIETTNRRFPAVEFGDSDRVRVGEIAIAIGSPFSLQGSVTVGYVSQKGRRVEILPYEDFIQIDAAINEGNSGGPLVNADGQLIGINSAVQLDSNQQNTGIAFAVPSNLAMVIAKSLIEKGVHEWPWVGAFFGPPMKEGKTNGVLITQVWRDTPAASAGVLSGDVVTRVNGKTVSNKYDVYRIIFNHSVGETLRFNILRNGKKLSFDLPLQEFPRQP